MLLSDTDFAPFELPSPQQLMVTGVSDCNYMEIIDAGKNIPPQPKVPSTSVAFGRGLTLRKKSKPPTLSNGQQQSKQHSSSLMNGKTKSSFIASSSVIRRSGSVGQLSERKTAANFPPAASTSSAVPAISVFNTNTSRSACKCRNGTACKCVPSMAFLEGVYVQNLQTQIEVLELENAYLRGASDRGAVLTMSAQNRTPMANIPTPFTTSRRRQSAGIQTETERRHDEEDEGDFELRTVDHRFSRKDKRVGFSTEERIVRNIEGEGSDEDLAAVGSDDGHYLYGLYKTSRRKGEEINTANSENARIREELAQKEVRLKGVEISRLNDEKEDLERRLRLAEGRISGERRSLLSENVELQRRLEGLTPLLAEKEAQLVKLEQELDAANTKLRSQSKQLSALQANLDERTKESQKHGTERERAEQRLRMNLETTNRELETSHAHEAILEKELAELRSKQEIREMNWHKEEQERQRIVEELNEELSVVGQRLDRSEREKSQLEAQLGEVKQKNDLLEMELDLARERISNEQDALREMNTKEREWQIEETEHRAALSRTQRELEALQALSQSLANENKGLREERVKLEERIGELREKSRSREGRIRRVSELLNEFLEKYRHSSGRFRQHLGRQAEECEEFEQIVQKVRQMVGSPSPPLGSAALRPSTTTSSSNSPSQLSSSKTATKRSAGRSSSSRAKAD